VCSEQYGGGNGVTGCGEEDGYPCRGIRIIRDKRLRPWGLGSTNELSGKPGAVQRAKFDRLYPFHCTRHSAVTQVYRKTRDLFLAQRYARHASPLKTTVYTHPSNNELASRTRGFVC